MSKPFIVLGDKTDHGGTVISASPFSDIGGKGMARTGDKVTCPRCKGVFSIVTGQLDMIVDGQPAAVHGDKTSCGATLLATGFTSTWGGDGNNNAGKQSSKNENNFGPSETDTNSEKNSESHDYDQRRIQVRSATARGVLV
jgi:uncharacterized Zn-binding protein involved in type VI secretion